MPREYLSLQELSAQLPDPPKANGKSAGEARIEALKQRERDIQAALAVERVNLAKREKRETDKEQSIIGAAVLKAITLSPEFKASVERAALIHITDEKQRCFLASRGWNL
jgi:hypothetical protein